jgi:Sec-independent protein translocase protein TatA
VNLYDALRIFRYIIYLAIFLVLLGVIKIPELARSLGIYLKQNKNNKSEKQLLKELKKKKMHYN